MILIFVVKFKDEKIWWKSEMEFFFDEKWIYHNFICPQFHFKKKDISNSYNNYFNSISISINFTKLKSVIQSTLGSLDQSLFIKIKISKLSHCKQHFLKICKKIDQWKNAFIFFYDFEKLGIYWPRNPIITNNDSCFSHHWREHLAFLISTW
jgi:hypothetical protein